MSSDRTGQSGDEPGKDKDEQPLGSALRHPNRTHVTLANLADLNLAAIANKTVTPEDESGGAEAGEGSARTGGVVEARGERYADDDGSWLSKLPTPVDEARAPRRGRGGDVDDLDDLDVDFGIPGDPGQGSAGALVPAPPPGELVAPDAVARPPATAPAVVPGRVKLPGAYGDTGEHRAWVVPSARVRGAEPDPEAAPVRTGWARLVERWLLEVVALALAAIAFVIPVFWMLLIAVATVAGAVVAYVASGHPVGSLPVAATRRAIMLLRPRSLVWVPVFAARTVLGAVAIPALVAAAVWYLANGTEGVAAAARAGAWEYGLRTGALLICLMLLTSVGDGRQQRAAAVRRWAAPATDGTLGILSASCLLLVALTVVAAPHPADSVAARADGLGWLPPGTRASVDELRDDIVNAELNSLVSCLSSRGGTIWKPYYTIENPLDEPDVARLVASREPAFSPPSDLVTVLLAAHNQLAPWVEAIEIEWPGGDLVRTERASLPRHEPLVDPAPLVDATPDGAQWVSSGQADEAMALRCSAAPVL